MPRWDGIDQTYVDDAVSGMVGVEDTIQVSIDGSDFAIAAGQIVGSKEIPYGCTITGVRMYSDASTTTVLDVWVDTYANYEATVADTIVAAANPTITAAIKSEDTTLTGWTTTLTKGSHIIVNVDSNDNATHIDLVFDIVGT